MWKFIESVGEEYQVVRGEINIRAVGKNITLEKGKGKQYHLFYDIKTVGKNINWGREEGDGNFEEENQNLKKGKNIKL